MEGRTPARAAAPADRAREREGSPPPGRGWGVVAAMAVATVLLGVAAFALRPSGSLSGGTLRSALRTTPDGVAALYRAIARLGPPTATRVTPLVDAEPLRGTLVMLQPARRPSPREVHELLEWVRGGGALIHAPRPGSPILDSLGLARHGLWRDDVDARARGAIAELEDALGETAERTGGSGEPAATEDGAGAEGAPTTGGASDTEGAPVAEGAPTTQDEPAAEDESVPEDEPGTQDDPATRDASAAAEDPLATEGAPATEGEPATEGAPATEGEPATEEAPAPATNPRRDGGPLWSAGHILTEGLPTARAARYAIVPDTASGDDGEEAAAGGDARPGPRPAPHDALLLSAPDSAGRRRAVIALLRLGEGRILSFADAEPLSNRLAVEAPSAVLAVRAAIAWTSPGDSVFFDEFSQGLGASRSPARATVDFLVGAPIGRASLHLGLVVLLAFLCAGLRLGAPLAPVPGPRRSALEHVTALAAVYEGARARETAALLMLGQLARAHHLPSPRDMPGAERLLARLETQSHRPHALRLIRQGLAARPVELIPIARGIDDHTPGRASA